MSLFKKNDGKTEHVWVEERLSAYLDDELSPQERTAVEHHLARCQDCQWNLRTLRQTVRLMKELPTVPVPRVFTIPVPAQKPARARQRSWGHQRGWGLGLLQGATALVAVLLMFAVAGDFVLTGLVPGRSAAPAPIVMKEQAVVDSAVTEVAEEEAPRAMKAASVPPSAVETETVAEKSVAATNEVSAAPAEPTAAPEATAAPLLGAAPPAPAGTTGPTSEPEAAALGATQFESPLEATQEAEGGGAAQEAPGVEEAPAAQLAPATEAAAAAAAAAAAEPAAEAGAEPTVVAQAEMATTSVPEAEAGQAYTTSTTAEPAGTMLSRASADQEPTAVAAAPALAQQADQERAGEQEQVQVAARDSLASGVRIAEIALGAAFVLLAATTITLTIRRRRAG